MTRFSRGRVRKCRDGIGSPHEIHQRYEPAGKGSDRGCTEDIKARIEGLRASTAARIGDTGRVSKVVEEVNGNVTNIAAAIPEQAAATRGIARIYP